MSVTEDHAVIAILISDKNPFKQELYFNSLRTEFEYIFSEEWEW